MNFGQKISVLMNEKGFTQTSLSQALGIAQTSVSSWQRNTSRPNKRTVLKLSTFFGIDPDVLVDDSLDIPQVLPTAVAKKMIPKEAYHEHNKAIKIAAAKKVTTGDESPVSNDDVVAEYSPQMQTKLLMEISEKLTEILKLMRNTNGPK